MHIQSFLSNLIAHFGEKLYDQMELLNFFDNQTITSQVMIGRLTRLEQEVSRLLLHDGFVLLTCWCYYRENL